MSTYTPTPWIHEEGEQFVYALSEDEKVNRTYILVQGGYENKSAGSRTGLDELEANARLIAAAPELLEALKETIPFMVEIAKARHHKFELHMADDDSTIGKAMRAIAKAEGRS